MRGFRGQVGDERDERGRSRRGEGRDGKVELPKEVREEERYCPCCRCERPTEGQN